MNAKSIFFSWQSDSPFGCNRGLIQDVFEKLLDRRKEENLRLEENLDRDTSNVQGAPDIIATVLNKIDQCNVFIADITTINHETEVKAPHS